MPESSSPNVVGELVLIHLIITRGLKVAVEHCESFGRQGYPAASAREGFVSYVRSLASSLHAHHLTEDDLVFPYFREKIPDAPFDVLSAQHRALVPLLEEIRLSIEEMASTTEEGEALQHLNRILAQIAEIWHPHIKTEEEHFTQERVDALINTEEHRRLCGLFGEHGRKHAGPDYLVVPFLLYNLPAEKRAAFARTMPPIVTQQLVPVVWKEKWEPMRPFLLS